MKFVVNEGHDRPFVWIDLSTPLNQRPNLGPYLIRNNRAYNLSKPVSREFVDQYGRGVFPSTYLA